MRNEPTLENHFVLANNLIREKPRFTRIVLRAAELLQNYRYYAYQNISNDLQSIAGKINAALTQQQSYEQKLEMADLFGQHHEIRLAMRRLDEYLAGTSEEKSSEWSVILRRGFSIRSSPDCAATEELFWTLEDYQQKNDVRVSAQAMLTRVLLAVVGSDEQVARESEQRYSASLAGLYFSWFGFYHRLSPRPLIEISDGRALVQVALRTLYPPPLPQPKPVKAAPAVKEADLSKIFG